MAYGAEISRDYPTCLVFAIDQSGSMADQMEGVGTKSQFLADVLNRTIYTMVTNCTKADGVRNYFDVGVIAYGGSKVGSGFGGALSNAAIHPITAIGDAPLRVEDRTKKVSDGAGGVIEQEIKFPVWFDPTNSGGTPMCTGMTHVAEVLVEWCDAHANSYPPTVLHVTDGESTDGDPEMISDGIRQLSTQDGQCLMFNLHVSASGGEPVIFPTSEGELRDQYSKLLFRMSSNLPSHLLSVAGDKGYSVSDGSRGFIFNAGPEFIVDFFEIGTRPRLMADR